MFRWELHSGVPLSIWKLIALFIFFELLYSRLHSCWYVNANPTRFCFLLGEKRFQTIQDLVADGLITMYIDTYAKDYVDTMMISPVKSEEKKDERKTVDYETKENDETAEEAVTKPRPRVEAETDAVDVKEKRQVFFLTL